MRAKYFQEFDDAFELDDKIHVSGFTITKQKKFFSNTSAVFGVEIHFKTNVVGFLVKYYLICGILVSFISSISFMIKPSVVPGRAGLLVTLLCLLPIQGVRKKENASSIAEKRSMPFFIPRLNILA